MSERPDMRGEDNDGLLPWILDDREREGDKEKKIAKVRRIFGKKQ